MFGAPAPAGLPKAVHAKLNASLIKILGSPELKQRMEDQGIDVKLSCTSSGHAWLSTLSEDDALQLVAKQGFGKPSEYGPKAPTTPTALLKAVRQARKQGYAMTFDTYAQGLSAISAPIAPRGCGAVGVLAISGPSVRLTEDKMNTLVPELLTAAADIANAAGSSPLFNRAYAGT